MTISEILGSKIRKIQLFTKEEATYELNNCLIITLYILCGYLTYTNSVIRKKERKK